MCVFIPLAEALHQSSAPAQHALSKALSSLMLLPLDVSLLAQMIQQQKTPGEYRCEDTNSYTLYPHRGVERHRQRRWQHWATRDLTSLDERGTACPLQVRERAPPDRVVAPSPTLLQPVEIRTRKLPCERVGNMELPHPVNGRRSSRMLRRRLHDS